MMVEFMFMRAPDPGAVFAGLFADADVDVVPGGTGRLRDDFFDTFRRIKHFVQACVEEFDNGEKQQNANTVGEPCEKIRLREVLKKIEDFTCLKFEYNKASIFVFKSG